MILYIGLIVASLVNATVYPSSPAKPATTAIERPETPPPPPAEFEESAEEQSAGLRHFIEQGDLENARLIKDTYNIELTPEDLDALIKAGKYHEILDALGLLPPAAYPDEHQAFIDAIKSDDLAEARRLRAQHKNITLTEEEIAELDAQHHANLVALGFVPQPPNYAFPSYTGKSLAQNVAEQPREIKGKIKSLLNLSLNDPWLKHVWYSTIDLDRNNLPPTYSLSADGSSILVITTNDTSFTGYIYRYKNSAWAKQPSITIRGTRAVASATANCMVILDDKGIIETQIFNEKENKWQQQNLNLPALPGLYRANLSGNGKQLVIQRPAYGQRLFDDELSSYAWINSQWQKQFAMIVNYNDRIRDMSFDGSNIIISEPNGLKVLTAQGEQTINAMLGHNDYASMSMDNQYLLISYTDRPKTDVYKNVNNNWQLQQPPFLTQFLTCNRDASVVFGTFRAVAPARATHSLAIFEGKDRWQRTKEIPLTIDGHRTGKILADGSDNTSVLFCSGQYPSHSYTLYIVLPLTYSLLADMISPLANVTERNVPAAQIPQFDTIIKQLDMLKGFYYQQQQNPNAFIILTDEQIALFKTFPPLLRKRLLNIYKITTQATIDAVRAKKSTNQPGVKRRKVNPAKPTPVAQQLPEPAQQLPAAPTTVAAAQPPSSSASAVRKKKKKPYAATTAVERED